MIQAHNRYPHNLSRGGYELLEEKMMEEKIKQRQESIEDSVVAPPSPPKRHEKWIRARQKSSGEYMSEETRCVADKIVSKMQYYSSLLVYLQSHIFLNTKLVITRY